jgi:hypothetical protein
MKKRRIRATDDLTLKPHRSIMDRCGAADVEFDIMSGFGPGIEGHYQEKVHP